MSGPFVLITTHRVKPGRLSELIAQTKAYNDFVEAHEPAMQAHVAYVDEGRDELALVQVHPDAESAEIHFAVAGEQIHRAADLVDNVAIDVYGEPGPRLRQALDVNAAAGARVSVRPGRLAGFLRS